MRRGSERQGWLSKLRRGSFGLAALFAIALQVFVVQTHVHTLAGGHAAPGFTQPANGAAAHALDIAGDGQQVCLLALAGAARTLLPGDAEIVCPEGIVFARAASLIRFVAAVPAHSWQSRAPPIAL